MAKNTESEEESWDHLMGVRVARPEVRAQCRWVLSGRGKFSLYLSLVLTARLIIKLIQDQIKKENPI